MTEKQLLFLQIVVLFVILCMLFIIAKEKILVLLETETLLSKRCHLEMLSGKLTTTNAIFNFSTPFSSQ